MWTFTRRRERRIEGNALPAPLDLNEPRRVLVIAPHPDDETMGCGGTLARLAPHADVLAVLVTNGDGAGELPAGTSETRKGEMTQALRRLGVAREPACWDEPDGRFADSPRYRERLAAVLGQHRPDWVFLPWLLDSHSDHARIALASCAVLKTSDVAKIIYYEIWTPVPATHAVDITSTIEDKRAALLCHRTALAHGNYLEATMGLGAYRSICVPTARYAEAFAVRTPRDCDRA